LHQRGHPHIASAIYPHQVLASARQLEAVLAAFAWLGLFFALTQLLLCLPVQIAEKDYL